MPKLSSGTAIAVAFLFGCSASYVAPRFLVPPVHAGTDPPRWEVRCVDAETARVGDSQALEVTNATGWNPVLKRFGQEGWEPVQFLRSEMTAKIDAVCFKRPLL
ncbi:MULTISPECIES: hypothetical protein [Sorangium]|uniref:hypothetical protein n=1 Tax=Sorangium TaxID=39643 RepID=UPI000779421B|nr:hypothetical protein BE11_28560 [Sorangium cellulosum]